MFSYFNAHSWKMPYVASRGKASMHGCKWLFILVYYLLISRLYISALSRTQHVCCRLPKQYYSSWNYLTKIMIRWVKTYPNLLQFGLHACVFIDPWNMDPWGHRCGRITSKTLVKPCANVRGAAPTFARRSVNLWWPLTRPTDRRYWPNAGLMLAHRLR